MKGLDETKTYDLRDLNDGQLQVFNRMFGKKINLERTPFISFVDNNWHLTFSTTRNKTSALTLFEPKLKIGDTFEKDGFICRVESEVKKWYVVDRGLDAYYVRLSEDEVLWGRADDMRVEEITDKEFIEQLEYHLDV